MATILVVDDQPSNRQFLTMLLGYCGHRTREAADGAEALQRMHDEPPDLVITDVRMPTVDGHELVNRLRSEPALSGIPVIFYSAAAYQREACALAASCGVVRILIKPAEPQLIIQTVNDVLGISPPPALIPALVTDFDRDRLHLPTDRIDPHATVFFVDDDRETREAVASLLESASLNVQTYATAEDFLEIEDLERPGCLVLDIRMPGMGGIRLLEVLRSRNIEIPAIVLTGHGDVPIAVRTLKLGVLAFLEKPLNPHILLAKTFEALLEDAGRRRKHKQAEALHQRLATLTAREWELLEMVTSGQSSKQIAAKLRISIKTVTNHRSHLMSKTGATNAADLARLRMLASVHDVPAMYSTVRRPSTNG
jgi:FixJ family two-component response regulator